jgi:REP element-mobilizing transposase RayT
MPDVPPRLNLVFQKYDPPLYFVTFNTHRRKKLLANARVHGRFIEFARAGAERGQAIGRFVIMPDHVHLFIRGCADYPVTQAERVL